MVFLIISVSVAILLETFKKILKYEIWIPYHTLINAMVLLWNIVDVEHALPLCIPNLKQFGAVHQTQ